MNTVLLINDILYLFTQNAPGALWVLET